MRADIIIVGASELVTSDGNLPKIGPDLSELSIIKNGSFAVKDGIFIDVGKENYIVSKYQADTVIDARGCSVLPGFVDPHTHVVYGGERSDEFELRVGGAAYEEIMSKGGGIISTVDKTRICTEDELFKQSKTRFKRMISFGTTTFEIKSGYGLDTKTELSQLMVAQKLGNFFNVTVKTTFLGAHAFPKMVDRRKYIELVKGPMLKSCKPYCDFIDVFCDRGAFTIDETEAITKNSGLPIRLHVDELSDNGGAQLAARLGAISADHLINTSNDGFKALARAGTVCTFLPGTSFILEKPFARAKDAIGFGCIIALASDRNPGSCTVESIQFVIGLACIKLGLTPAQAINAATINAAYSLGLHAKKGSIKKDKHADFIVTDVPTYKMLPYEFTVNHVDRIFIGGRQFHG